MNLRTLGLGTVCLMAVIALGACADTPTAHADQLDPTAAYAMAVYDPGSDNECDPWLDPFFCGEDPWALDPILGDGGDGDGGEGTGDTSTGDTGSDAGNTDDVLVVDEEQDPCSSLLARFDVVTCEPMTISRRTWILDFFQSSDFRKMDPNCMQLKGTMTDVIQTRSQGYWGITTPGYTTAGLSMLGSVSGAVGVWFSDRLSEQTRAEQERVIGHEAYHLGFLDRDNTMADSAAKYCFSQTSVSPWVETPEFFE